jgi:monoamine oxidase
MPRRGVTPLSQQIRRTLAAHATAQRTGIPVEEVLGQSAAVDLTRRDFLRGAGALTAAGVAVAAGMRPAPARATAGPSVVIVGAGLAGIRAAHWLYRVKAMLVAARLLRRGCCRRARRSADQH